MKLWHLYLLLTYLCWGIALYNWLGGDPAVGSAFAFLTLVGVGASSVGYADHKMREVQK